MCAYGGGGGFVVVHYLIYLIYGHPFVSHGGHFWPETTQLLQSWLNHSKFNESGDQQLYMFKCLV